MQLLSVVKYTGAGNKKFTAVFEDKEGVVRKTHFGQQGSQTFLNHRDNAKKRAYIARHSVNEDFSDLTSAGALSRWLLWEYPSLDQAVREYRKRLSSKYQSSS